MAERGAHITQVNLPKPSIFEVVSQQSLAGTIHPAFKRIIEFLGSSNPEKFGWLIKWGDEVFLILDLILQNHYLFYHDSSFSEAFYGLRRCLLHDGIEHALNRKGRILSLLQLVILPYVSRKIEKYLMNLREKTSYGAHTGTKNNLILYYLLKAHSTYRFAWESAVFYYLLAYLSNKSKSHSPLFRILNLTLSYTEENELKNIWNDTTAKNRWFSPKTIGRGLLHCLEIGAFTLQFLQWWQAEQLTINFSALPVPPPPTLSLEDKALKNKCPVCRNPWRLQTLLPVSGYVFCFRCIMHHLQQNGSCPVTGYPASARDLVRLYKS